MTTLDRFIFAFGLLIGAANVYAGIHDNRMASLVIGVACVISSVVFKFAMEHERDKARR